MNRIEHKIDIKALNTITDQVLKYKLPQRLP